VNFKDDVVQSTKRHAYVAMMVVTVLVAFAVPSAGLGYVPVIPKYPALIGSTSCLSSSSRRRNIHRHVSTTGSYRYRTRLRAKDEKRVRPPNINRPLRWIACSSTKELSRAVQVYIQPGDRVAELGSALRETSIAICETIGPNGHATLVDVKRNFPKREDVQRTTAMRREGDEEEFYTDRAEFVEIDGFRYWRSALFFDNIRDAISSYDVLVADVSSIAGNDLDLTAISLIREFLELNDTLPCTQEDDRCRVVIVKSASLNAWARRLVHAQRLAGGSVSTLLERRLRGQVLHTEAPCRVGFVSPLVIGTVGVEEYRRTIPYVVRLGDSVLEVGCHLGTSTIDIHNAAHDENGVGGCIGVDIGRKIIKGARQRHPDVPFEVADAWHTGELLRLSQVHLPAKDATGYDAVYVDVGGLSGSDGLLEALSLLTALGNALEPRSLVIKSLCVRRLASCLVSFSEVWQSDEEMRNRIL